MKDSEEQLKLFQHAIARFVPHNAALGLSFQDITTEPPTVTLRLPFSEKLVGNPLTGVLHGGAVTTLLDATCGAAVYVKLQAPLPIATLDLRVDFLDKPPAGRDLLARARVVKAGRRVTTLHAHAWQEREDTPIAMATVHLRVQP